MHPLARNGALTGLLVASACGRDPAQPRTDSDAPALMETDDLTDPAAVVQFLSPSHAAMRTALGPHRLTYRAHFVSSPDPRPPALPALDAPVYQGRDLVDELELVWASAGSDAPRYALEQRNDAGRGRHVIRLDDQLYVRLEHRPWSIVPLESDIDQTWLDDALRSAHDAFAFVAPAIELGVDSTDGHARLGISLAAETPDTATPPSEDPAASDRAPWRDKVVFEAIEGVLELNLTRGAWSALDLDARYHIEGTPLQGRFRFKGSLTPADPNALPEPTAPDDAMPISDRRRLDEERRRLLQGLTPL